MAQTVIPLAQLDAALLSTASTIAVTNGGTGRTTSTTAYGLLAAGTTATGVQQTLAAGLTTQILVGGGASALPAWTTATGSGAPVRAISPALVTPALGVASATSINFGGGALATYVPKTAFTPTVLGLTTAGTATYVTQVGHYSRTGNEVNIRISLNITAHTGTGNMAIGGLPLAVADANTVFTCTYGDLTSPASTFVSALASTGESQIRLYSISIATGLMNPLALDTSFQIYISGTYYV